MSILTTDKWEDTNCNGIEHVLLSTIAIGSEEIAIIRAHLYNTLIHTNQASYSIDSLGHGDWDFYLRSWKIFNEMNIYFGQNRNDDIGVNH